MIRPIQVTLFALCALVLLSPAARADEVVKKDGSSVIGFILVDGRTSVTVLDKNGRKIRVRRTDIDTVIEDSQTGNEAIDAKLEDIDTDDADELFEVAEWAQGEKEKGWKLVCHYALRVDEDHAGANKALGHILVGDTWFKSKKKAEKARKELEKEEREAAGYIWWRGGWIMKEDRSKASRNKDDWMLTDEGEWVLTATYMKEKGFMKVGDKWVKAGSPEDKAAMDTYLERTGEKIWIYTSDHFRLWVQGFQPDEVYELSQLCEKTWDWFHETLDVPQNKVIWGGNKAQFYVFKSYDSVIEWFGKYRQEMGLSEGFLNLLTRNSGALLVSGAGNGRIHHYPIAIHITPENAGAKQRLPHQLVNHAANCLLSHYSPGAPVPDGATRRQDTWLYESFGVYTEHQLLKRGIVLHTTNQEYDASGGVADKQFSTESAPLVAKGTVRSGDDERFDSLVNIQLNQLTPEHMAKGYTIIDWVMKTRAEEFKKWLQVRNSKRTPEATREVFGMDYSQFDQAWAKWVLKNY